MFLPLVCSKNGRQTCLISYELENGCNIEPIGEVLNYMELVRQIDHDRLFVTVNMRSWFDDDSMDRFLKDVLGKKLRLLLLESTARPLLQNEYRLTVERD